MKLINSHPPLGLEHNAFEIEINRKYIWIDCPSTFNNGLEVMDKILFTHHHFIAAANLYRNQYGTQLIINQKDSENSISSKYTFDKLITKQFKIENLEGFLINGHTKGFMFYIYKNHLFICDYVFLEDIEMRFNPYGPSNPTREGALHLKKIIESRTINKVCGYNYVINYDDWKDRFNELLR